MIHIAYQDLHFDKHNLSKGKDAEFLDRRLFEVKYRAVLLYWEAKTYVETSKSRFNDNI